MRVFPVLLIQEDDELPTAVCVKCIGALEFLCDFYDWCHRTQEDFKKELGITLDCELSGNESDKENISPEKVVKRTLKDKNLDENSNKENDDQQTLISQLEGNVDLEKEISQVKKIQSPKKVVTTTELLDKELVVSLCKQVYPKNGLTVKNLTPKPKEISLKSNKNLNITLTRLSSEKIVTNKDNKEKSTDTPLTQWLKGTSPMNKKRKRNESPVRNQVVVSRLSESKYGKISELMTDAQKETIENHYRVDMSLVDEVKVAENMKILSRNQIECKICNKKYSRMDKCQVHIWRHLEMKPYLCGACKFTTLTVSNIRCHIRKSHLKLKPYVCPLCEKQYTAPNSLEEHLNTHTGAKPFNCNQCNFSSSSKQVLSYHKLTHKAEKDVECEVCGKAFYSKGRLRAHKFVHMKDTTFKCKNCSSYFMQKEALDKHYATSHRQDYQCNICNKYYKSKKALNNHQNVHSEAKFQCSLCPNRYKSHHILKEHLLKHGGIRKYKCQTCEKTFAQQSHLAAHMAVHSGVRYECPGCKKGFNRHDNMKVHTKRCSDFLRNPALKELLSTKKKMKTESVSSDSMSVSSKDSINSSKTNVSNAKRTVTKIEPNDDLENSDRDSDSPSSYLFRENRRKTSEIIHSYNDSDDDEDDEDGDDDDDDDDNDDNVISRGEISVTENILSPECF